MARFLTIGLATSLALSACATNNKTEPQPFQPTQTQPIQTQTSQAEPIPDQSTQATKTKTIPFQPTQTQTVKTQIISTEAVPFQPTQTQVIQAQQQLGAQTTEREVRITLPADVLFDFDKADVRPDAAEALRQTLTVIRYYKNTAVRIEGHTDSEGSDAYNQTLSEQRSQSVQQWLTTQGGVAVSQLTTQGFGESKPRAQNTKLDGSDNPIGRQLNRRVEIVIQKQA